MDTDNSSGSSSNNKAKTFGVGGYRGRIIFLGDGTEVLTDSDDTEMFDQEDKDKDTQVDKTSSTDESTAKSEATAEKTGEVTDKKEEAAAPDAQAATSEAKADEKKDA